MHQGTARHTCKGEQNSIPAAGQGAHTDVLSVTKLPRHVNFLVPFRKKPLVAIQCVFPSGLTSHRLCCNLFASAH